ncbi:hypothetical protein Tco_0941990 [Tanacetum coccineum]|uniref:Uncharacterized protein n=1 Tax=Tanacetum coccineum TaxID=301880 RepID=A0ABQ5DSE8_9ASTR
MAAAMKHMASNFAKLEKFEGFQKMAEEDALLAFQHKRRAKWDNDDYVCRGLILNGLSDSLFDIYQNDHFIWRSQLHERHRKPKHVDAQGLLIGA